MQDSPASAMVDGDREGNQRRGLRYLLQSIYEHDLLWIVEADCCTKDLQRWRPLSLVAV